ncbi:MAG: right-handed parallel beta-helix repeat-containing protein [Planctomycetota bacterium]
MHLTKLLAVATLGLASLTSAQSVADFYVNGRTGRDHPSYGGSPAMPWKTITYAITQIPPITNSSEWNTLYVEGDQVYSPSTNGEVMPIRPAYNLWIEGSFVGHGRMPILQPPVGGVAMLFDPAIVYSRNPSTMRYLVFDGGSHGMRMGNSANQRHRPRIQDCTFRNQTVAGVRIDQADNSRGIDPRFFQSLFTDAPRGIEVFATVSGAVVYPDVEECTFTGLSDAAIFLDDTSAGGNVGGTFRSNWFQACERGIHVRSGPAALTTNFEVYSCSFRDIRQEAVWLDIVRPSDPSALIQQSSFLRCGSGVVFAGTLAPGPYSLTLSGNVVQGCTRGVRADLSGTGTCAVESRDNTVTQCDVGLDVSAGPSVQLLLRSERDRFLFNTDTGVSSAVSGSNSTVTLQSDMVCGNTARGILLSGNTPVVAHSLTLADNGLGLSTGAPTTFDHCIFANGTEVQGSPAITYSSFLNVSYAGTGNLGMTDPRLIRPLYKLDPSSPCIDAGNVATPLPATDYEGDPRSSVSRPNGPQLPDLGADEYVQLGSARKYGLRGFGYYNFFPEIGSPSTRIVIGGQVTVELSGAILPVFGVPANDAFLTLGLRDDPGGLPFDLGVIGSPGSLLWNELNAVIGLFPVTPIGTATVTLPIPGSPLLVGQTFTFQWLANQFSANPRGPVASDGLRVTVGQ